MLKVIAAGLALAMVLTAGCSSDPEEPPSNPCENVKSKCPNDPPFPVQTCKDAIAHPTCSNQFIAYMVCARDHQTCGSDGKTVEAATNRQCTSQINAADQCAAKVDGG